MTDVVETHHHPHAPAPPRRGKDHLIKAGFIRAIWMTALFFGIGAGACG